MKDKNYQPPKFKSESFHCPFCNVLTSQSWSRVSSDSAFEIYTCLCFNCGRKSIWLENRDSRFVGNRNSMVYPITSTAPIPHEDMPEDVKEIYEEARQIQQYSPRATAALLRVALEKLTVHLGETTGKLNTRIANLKKKGLPQKVIDSLDIVRITANEGGSHSGTIDLESKDNSGIVDKLFFLVNFIVEKTISEPQMVGNMFSELPPDKKTGIKDRDNKTP